MAGGIKNKEVDGKGEVKAKDQNMQGPVGPGKEFFYLGHDESHWRVLSRVLTQ